MLSIDHHHGKASTKVDQPRLWQPLWISQDCGNLCGSAKTVATSVDQPRLWQPLWISQDCGNLCGSAKTVATSVDQPRLWQPLWISQDCGKLCGSAKTVANSVDQPRLWQTLCTRRSSPSASPTFHWTSATSVFNPLKQHNFKQSKPNQNIIIINNNNKSSVSFDSCVHCDVDWT